MHHNECWACGSAVIYYRDVLDMYWCEPCWNTADGICATMCDHPRCYHEATTIAGELGGARVCAEHVEWAS